MNIIHCNNINEVRDYYGKKYSKILDSLEKKNAYTFSIDKDCGSYLELWFHIGDYFFYKVNIGLNNKFNVWKMNNIYCKDERYCFATQSNVVDFILKQ